MTSATVVTTRQSPQQKLSKARVHGVFREGSSRERRNSRMVKRNYKSEKAKVIQKKPGTTKETIT